MQMNGEARIEAPREQVWKALNDSEMLKASIPGCEAMARNGDGAFDVTVVSKVGPIKARFSGKLSLSNVVSPISYTLTGEGSGGAAGFARADIDVRLDALEPAVTMLHYGVKASLGGKLAQLGSRMIDAAARKSADDFFEQFSRHVVAARGLPVADPAVSGALLQGLGASMPAAAPIVEPVAPPTLQPEGASSGDGSANAAMTVLTAQQIKIWIADQIAVVTLSRPGSRNAMTSAMWTAVPAIFGALERNPEVRAVILTGEGKDFCAGADIPEFERVRADVDQATRYEAAVDACCDAIAGLSKPTIAVLRGYCLGGGANLAMSCDFRYAAPDAVFGIPAARLSIIYGVRGTRKLLSLVGLPAAKRVLFGAQRFAAAEALEMGFVDHVPGLEKSRDVGWWGRRSGSAKTKGSTVDPMVEARRFADSLKQNAPLSIAGAKALLNGMAMGSGALDLVRAEALIAQAAGSQDYREGRAAFAEKRLPKFAGC